MKKSVLMICIVCIIMTTYAVAAVNPNKIIAIGYQNDSIMKEIDNENGNVGKVIKNVTLMLGAAGIAIGLCVGVIYALMWITSTPAKKADLKERILPLVLGIILLFGGPGLAATFISALAGILN